MAGYQEYLAANVPGMVPSPGLGQGGMPQRGMPGQRPGMNPGSPDRTLNMGGPMPPAQSAGLGSGVPNLRMYEDNSMGYPGTASPSALGPGSGDPLLMLLQILMNKRFPNGM